MHPARNQNQNRKTKRKMKMKMKMNKEMEMKMSGLGTETKEKEKIIVQGIQNDAEKGLCSKFYEIDMAKGCVKEIRHALYHCMNSITSIGSVLYVVGGIPSDMFRGIKPSVCRPYMFYLDLDSDSGEGGWKEIPYLSPADAYLRIPSAVSFGGNFYVFAAHTTSPSAIVFNSNTNKLDTLLPPSDVGFFDLPSSASVVADPDNNRLLVPFKTSSSIYAYYPSNNTWELFVDSFNCSKFVFADGVFYVYLSKTRTLLDAFDTVTKQWLEIEFTSAPPEKMWMYRHAAMLYLGNGLMCLVDSISRLGDSPGTYVSVAKFRFKRCTDRPGVLIITPLPMETYKLNTLSSIINYHPF